MNDSDSCVLDFPDPPLKLFRLFLFFLDRGGSMGSDDSVANQWRCTWWQYYSYGELIVNLLLVTQRPLPRIVNKGTNGFVEYGDPVVSNQFLLLPWTMDESVTLMHSCGEFPVQVFQYQNFPTWNTTGNFWRLGVLTYCFWVSAATEATIFWSTSTDFCTGGWTQWLASSKDSADGNRFCVYRTLWFGRGKSSLQ